MSKNKIVKTIVDKFLIEKEGQSILKDIEKKKLVDSGILWTPRYTNIGY